MIDRPKCQTKSLKGRYTSTAQLVFCRFHFFFFFFLFWLIDIKAECCARLHVLGRHQVLLKCLDSTGTQTVHMSSATNDDVLGSMQLWTFDCCTHALQCAASTLIVKDMQAREYSDSGCSAVAVLPCLQVLTITSGVCSSAPAGATTMKAYMEAVQCVTLHACLARV